METQDSTKKLRGVLLLLLLQDSTLFWFLVICSFLWELSLNTMSFQFKMVWANRHFEE